MLLLTKPLEIFIKAIVSTLLVDPQLTILCLVTKITKDEKKKNIEIMFGHH